MELCVISLHGHNQDDIDYIPDKHSEINEPMAINIIASGGYEDVGEGEVLVYSGQGGNCNVDQKLERGNLALE